MRCLVELMGQHPVYDFFGISTLCELQFTSARHQFDPVEAYANKGLEDIESFLRAWPGQWPSAGR